MSQSPLARKRKSLTAFSRAPSQLSRSVTASGLDESANGSGSGRASEQNAFATPPRERRSRRERESLPAREETSFRDSSSFRDSPSYRDSPSQTTPPSDTSRRSTLDYTPVSTPTRPAAHRIVYSPYMTPPAGPSRSAFTPLDLSAPSSTPRKTEDRLRAAAPSTPGTKKPRLVRRKALWRRIIESPGNALDTALFHLPTSVDEMLPPVRWAHPIALVLYVVHWLLLAPLRAVQSDAVFKGERAVVDSIGNRWERQAAARSGVAGKRAALLYTILLIALAGANAAWLFTRYRNYDLQLRSGTVPLNSPHASPVPAPRVRPMDAPDEELPAPDEAPLHKAVRLAGTGLWALTKWIYRSILGAVGARPPATIAGTSRGDSIQSLRVWDPPEFCLAFFCAMPPSAPIIASFLTGQHPFLTPLVLAIAAAVMSHLAACFTQLVRDRMMLSAEVMREYDHRFVYKRIFAPRVDRGVGTSDSVMLP